MQIHHIATVEDWEAAKRSGAYRTSTRGRSLEDEGFLHAARRDQVQPVFQRYYRDVREPLLLLTIDTDRLEVPWREDEVGNESYPHIYGALSPKAVIGVQPLNRRGGTETLTTLFVKEMLRRVGLALVVMLLAGAGSVVVPAIGAGGELLGALVGMAVGVAVVFAIVRR
ncbi:MAG: DUF952 domain-containing protein [Marmoricola sp.]